jgi:thiol-disulfide isomerase/thioredoxin
MKKLPVIVVALLTMLSCTSEKQGPPFNVEFTLEENDGRVPPILALTMGGNYIFDPQYPGEPTQIPAGLENGEVIHGILDTYQYVSQGVAKGFIDSSIYKRNNLLIKEETITDEWVDVIVTIAVGEDEEGNTLVYVENENGGFDTENPVYFEPTTVEFQDNVFEVMEAVISPEYEFFNGSEVENYKREASLMYLTDMGFESLQMYYEKLRFGTWTVNNQTFDVALIKESAPPYRKEPYTYFYVDMNGDGEFDIMEDGVEAYPVTEPFNIAGESWEISGIALDGSRIIIDKSETEVNPKVALRAGTEAPVFEAETIGGEPLSLADLKGKYVLLDFWGTWCGPCIEALPKLKKAHEMYGGEQFEIVGVANELNRDNFLNFIEREEIEWPQILEIYEENNKIQEMYSVNSFPTYYLINPEGEIVEYGLALSDENLMETLAKYLD